MIAIYKYGFDTTRQRFEDAGVVLKTLTNYEILLRAAVQSGYISKDELDTLNEWKANPSEWKSKVSL